MSGLRLGEGGTTHVYLHAPHHKEKLMTHEEVRTDIMTPHSMTAAAGIVAGLIGSWMFSLVASAPLHAQDFSADLNRGKMVYERHCQSCHGAHGRGDGIEGYSLTVPPANFQKAKSFFKSDEDMLKTIEYGVVFSPMHSWLGTLSEGEMQDVLAYIRTLFQQGG